MLDDIVILVLFVITFVIKGSYSCNIQMCFTWKVSMDTLTLICKVQDLHFRVLIGDPHGNIQAECLPPHQQTRCDPYYKNVTITQNKATNETIFAISGNIDYNVNGKWTCRHGTKKDKAMVDVTVLKTNGNNNLVNHTAYNCTNLSNSRTCTEYSYSDRSCLKTVLVFSMGSFLSTLMITLIIMAVFNKNIHIVEDCVKTNHNCLCIQNIKYPIIVCRRTIFLAVTVTFVAFSALIGVLDDDSCSYRFALLPLGLTVGLISGILFFDNKGGLIQTSPIQTRDRAEQLIMEGDLNESEAEV